MKTKMTRRLFNKLFVGSAASLGLAPKLADGNSDILGPSPGRGLEHRLRESIPESERAEYLFSSSEDPMGCAKVGEDGAQGPSWEFVFAATVFPTLLPSQFPRDSWEFDEAEKGLRCGHVIWWDYAPMISALTPYLWRAQREMDGVTYAPKTGWEEPVIIGRYDEG